MDLPAKYHSQYSPINWLDWLCYLAGKSETAPRIFFLFIILIFLYLFRYETMETHARAFLTLIIFAIGPVVYFDQVHWFSAPE